MLLLYFFSKLRLNMSKNSYTLILCKLLKSAYKQHCISMHCIPHKKRNHLFFSSPYLHDAPSDALVCKCQNWLEINLSLVLKLYDTIFNHMTVADDVCLLHIPRLAVTQDLCCC